MMACFEKYSNCQRDLSRASEFLFGSDRWKGSVECTDCMLGCSVGEVKRILKQKVWN